MPGAGPPLPAGLEMETVKVSSVSTAESTEVCTVKVCGPEAAGVKVRVPDAAV